MQNNRLRFAFVNRESDVGAKDDDDIFSLPSFLPLLHFVMHASHRISAKVALVFRRRRLLNSLRGTQRTTNGLRVLNTEFAYVGNDDARLNTFGVAGSCCCC